MVAVFFSFFLFFVFVFLGKLHVMQQDRYSVWAQSTELGWLSCYYTPLTLPPLPLCALVETPHTKKDLLQPRAPCLRKYFSKCVFSVGMAVFSTRWQPVAHANWIQDNAEKGDRKCHAESSTVHTVSKISRIMPTWSVEEILDWCRIYTCKHSLYHTLKKKDIKMAHSLKNDRRQQQQHPVWTNLYICINSVTAVSWGFVCLLTTVLKIVSGMSWVGHLMILCTCVCACLCVCV